MLERKYSDISLAELDGYSLGINITFMRI